MRKYDSSKNELFIKLWLITFILTGVIFTLSACDQGGSAPNHADRSTAITPGRTSMYDPTLDTAPGDTRPTAPPTDAVAPALESNETNTGILTPTSAANAVGAHR
jgi:hypothetical protein